MKNNLQVVSSLLNLQADSVADPQAREAFRESQNRVRSMALIHEKLYQAENLARIDMADYVHSLATSLFRSYSIQATGIQLKINVEDISLDIDTAVPCGLILSELVSNALKHAFPDGQGGEIHVALYRNNEYVFTVGDSGVGLAQGIDLQNTNSLGLRLVNILVEQLEGRVSIDRTRGTGYRITFSADSKEG